MTPTKYTRIPHVHPLRPHLHQLLPLRIYQPNFARSMTKMRKDTPIAIFDVRHGEKRQKVSPTDPRGL